MPFWHTSHTPTNRPIPPLPTSPNIAIIEKYINIVFLMSVKTTYSRAGHPVPSVFWSIIIMKEQGVSKNRSWPR